MTPAQLALLATGEGRIVGGGRKRGQAERGTTADLLAFAGMRRA